SAVTHAPETSIGFLRVAAGFVGDEHPDSIATAAKIPTGTRPILNVSERTVEFDKHPFAGPPTLLPTHERLRRARSSNPSWRQIPGTFLSRLESPHGDTKDSAREQHDTRRFWRRRESEVRRVEGGHIEAAHALSAQRQRAQR